MTDPDDHRSDPVALDLGDGTSVEAAGVAELDGAAVPLLHLRMPAARAHWLAHALRDGTMLGASDSGLEPSDRTLAHGLESVAAAVGELNALQCAASSVVGQSQRILRRGRAEGPRVAADSPSAHRGGRCGGPVDGGGRRRAGPRAAGLRLLVRADH